MASIPSCTYTDGSKYEGEFSGLLPHGHGKIIYTSGTFVTGLWKSGTLQKGKINGKQDVETHSSNQVTIKNDPFQRLIDAISVENRCKCTFDFAEIANYNIANKKAKTYIVSAGPGFTDIKILLESGESSKTFGLIEFLRGTLRIFRVLASNMEPEAQAAVEELYSKMSDFSYGKCFSRISSIKTTKKLREMCSVKTQNFSPTSAANGTHGYCRNVYEYKGEWLNGKRHGRGRCHWFNLRYNHEYVEVSGTYEGEWLDGKMHGLGSFTWNCGTRFYGSWKNGKRDGKGTFYFPNGAIVEGFTVRPADGFGRFYGFCTLLNGYKWDVVSEGLSKLESCGCNVRIEPDRNGVPLQELCEHHESLNKKRKFLEEEESEPKKQKSDLCKICMDSDAEVAFAPCGHLAACVDCAKRVEEESGKCPICKTEIVLTIKIYQC